VAEDWKTADALLAQTTLSLGFKVTSGGVFIVSETG
jgi:hypothetical protein